MTLSAAQIFSSVREELLGEAKGSPGLLADLANLERYIAETYSARSLIELLQNADDAKAQRFLIARHGDWLVCANDGQIFSRQDFYSLCRSASSSKQRGQTIGYRGIGFKSVVGVASSVHLLSGELNATFSRNLTKTCLGIDTPTPLVRIPHELAIEQSDEVLDYALKLKQSGFNTVFIFGGLDVERVQDEFDQFDSDYLLFLRQLREVTVLQPQKIQYFCERSTLDTDIREVLIKGPDRSSIWRVRHVNGCDLAFSINDGKAVPLNAPSAIAHAFLPTLEATGFGIRINADFSTDPSRTRIVFDDATIACIESAADAIATTLSNALLMPEVDTGLIACLTPTVDLATISLQKRSFRTELIARVKTRLSYLKEKIVLAPTWLNQIDSQKLASSFNRTVLTSDSTYNGAQTNFMRYIGVQSISAHDVIQILEKIPLSIKGCAEIIACCARSAGTGINLRQIIDKPIWKGEKHDCTTTLSALISSKAPLATEFVEAINSAGVSPNELGKMMRSASLELADIKTVLPDFLAEATFSSLAPSVAPFLNPESNSPLQSTPLDPLLASSTQLLTAFHTSHLITSRSLPGAAQSNMLRSYWSNMALR